MAAIDIHPFQPVIISALVFLLLGLLINNPGCEAEDILFSGESLDNGASLQYGAYNLVMQQDCNLVFYQNGSKLWDSGTAGAGQNCSCSLQSNGKLIIKEPGNDQVLWQTYNYGFHDKYALAIQKDGSVVIYGPVMTKLHGAMTSDE
ncbi:hypothetical protein NE237_029163 [Protea cynaroides]|uniref:Bulb-type lectin domain-containing protein n=1 Tax=Protea cynaroides TaxID=273540 RepID=A0A9Q0GSM0_9MAGN|nr:hypothetical protein NE237_029163 [Protea cynaroides]